MSRDPSKEIDMTRIYCKLEELVSRLNQANPHNIKVNIDVPFEQYPNFSVNVRSHPTSPDSGIQRIEAHCLDCKSKQVKEEKGYQISINKTNYQKPSAQFNYQGSTSFQSEGKHYQTTVINNSAPQQMKIEMQLPASFKRQTNEALEKHNEANPLIKSWEKTSYTTKKEENPNKKEISSRKISTIEESPSFQHSYTYSLSDSSALFDKMNTEYKQLQKEDDQNQRKNKQQAFQYSHRLQILNQKLRNSFLKWDNEPQKIIIREVETAKRKTTPLKKPEAYIQRTVLTSPPTKKVSISPPPKRVKVSPSKKIETSPPNFVEPIRTSRIQLGPFQCNCKGQRPSRTKRSISPFFNCYHYRYQTNIDYKPYNSPKKVDESKKEVLPTRCRNVNSSSEDMQHFISDIRSVYKSRGMSKNTDISTLDSSKKYTAHKLTKKYPEKKRSTSSLAKTKSASLKPYQGCFHRCFACCNQL